MPKESKPQKQQLTLSEAARRAGKVGGKARMASLSKKERAELTSKAGKASASSLSPEARHARALKASHARASYKAKLRGK